MKKQILALWMILGMVAAGTPAVLAADAVAGNEKTADAVNHLIERAIDGQKGFAESAEQVKSPELKARFLASSAERAGFAKELQNKVGDLGQKAEKGGSLEASAHRAWIDVKTAAVKQDDQAVLGAVKTGESAALNAYKDALNKDLPQDVRDIVQKQLDKIQDSYNWVEQRLTQTTH